MIDGSVPAHIFEIVNQVQQLSANIGPGARKIDNGHGELVTVQSVSVSEPSRWSCIYESTRDRHLGPTLASVFHITK